MMHKLDIFQKINCRFTSWNKFHERLKMQLTKEQRVFEVKNYFETKYFEIVQQSFEERLPERSLLGKMTIWINIR